MTNDELKFIYVEVANGRGNHGSFLRAFAEAVIRADALNFEVLKPAATELVFKYDLDKYLDKGEEA